MALSDIWLLRVSIRSMLSFVPHLRADCSVAYESFDQAVPSSVWDEVATVFSAAFSAPPYLEDPSELSRIVVWGPEQLAQTGGRLVTARNAERLVGFALAHGLEGDSSWLGILGSLNIPDSRALEMLTRPLDTVVVHELAVVADQRGKGIARSCLRMLLSDRIESRVVLGVYEQAADARSMYDRWGFEDIGVVQMARVSLRVLTASLVTSTL